MLLSPTAGGMAKSATTGSATTKGSARSAGPDAVTQPREPEPKAERATK